MGLESYYTSRSISAYRAGTVNIVDYTGNVVIERTLVAGVGIDILYTYIIRDTGTRFLIQLPICCIIRWITLI